MEFRDFILAHDGEDPAVLALQRSRYASEVDDFDLALTTLEVRRKLRLKVPQWYANPALWFPLRLSGEQCSSSETAFYKAMLVSMGDVSSMEEATCCKKTPEMLHQVAQPGHQLQNKAPIFASGGSVKIADLTGGLGVDAWAFAHVAEKVLYNEMNPALADAAKHNFKELGINNITVTSRELVPSAISAARYPVNPGITPSLVDGSSCPVIAGGDRQSTVREILGGFEPDIIFLDPARRGEGGRKVFRLEDCSPDVTALLQELYAACPKVMLKLSPMADITMVCSQLPGVKQVHVVEAEGECKELLLCLEKGWTKGYTITVYASGSTLTFSPSEEESAAMLLSNAKTLQTADIDSVHGRKIFLFEPGKALMKSGAFKLLCARFGLRKLGANTHLYTSAQVVRELLPFGKWFEIEKVLPLSGKSMKLFKGIKADVTSRGLPLSSDELRKRSGVLPGDGSVHLYGAGAPSGNVLILGHRKM